MTIDVFPLFATPLYKTNIDYDNQDIIEHAKKEKFIFIKNGYHSENVYILNCSRFKKLKEIIQKNIDFYVYEVLEIEKTVEFYITNSWIMKHEKGHWSQEHYHDNCLISGVYYFDVKENSGIISFSKSNANLSVFPSFFGIPFVNDNIFNVKKYKIIPKNNDLIIFPSHLSHDVSENQNDETRYCLAFNLFIKATLGSDKSFNKIDFK